MSLNATSEERRGKQYEVRKNFCSDRNRDSCSQSRSLRKQTEADNPAIERGIQQISRLGSPN